MEDVPVTQDSDPQDLAPPEHTMPRGDKELSDEHCEETDTHCPLAELLEQFWQLKDQFTSLKSTPHQSTPMAEWTQLIDKLQHLTTTLQLHSVHKIMQAYMDTLGTLQRESKLTTTVLQDIPTFDGQDSSKLKYWFMDKETAADILIESCTHLVEAKS